MNNAENLYVVAAEECSIIVSLIATDAENWWIDKASKYYLESIKGKYKKWKTKKTFWLKELKSME